MLPNTTDTDLKRGASVQTTTRRRQASKTGPSILAPVGATIAMRVLNRDARPRTRLVPAGPPRLAASTAGTTLGAPRGVGIPGLYGSRGRFPTITGARPTRAPSTGMLRPPKMVFLPLLVDAQ